MRATSPVRIAVQTTPNARESRILGWTEEGVLRVRVAAAPEAGKANAALLALLARALGLPPSALSIKNGAGSRRKVIIVEGRAAEEVRARLGTALF